MFPGHRGVAWRGEIRSLGSVVDGLRNLFKTAQRTPTLLPPLVLLIEITPPQNGTLQHISLPHSLTSSQIFYSFFKTLVGQRVTVELKNDMEIEGRLESVDQFLNVKLSEINVIDEEKYPHLVRKKRNILDIKYSKFFLLL